MRTTSVCLYSACESCSIPTNGTTKERCTLLGVYYFSSGRARWRMGDIFYYSVPGAWTMFCLRRQRVLPRGELMNVLLHRTYIEWQSQGARQRPGPVLAVPPFAPIPQHASPYHVTPHDHMNNSFLPNTTNSPPPESVYGIYSNSNL